MVISMGYDTIDILLDLDDLVGYYKNHNMICGCLKMRYTPMFNILHGENDDRPSMFG